VGRAAGLCVVGKMLFKRSESRSQERQGAAYFLLLRFPARAPHGRACGSARAIRRTARQFSSFRAKGLVEARALAALVSEAYRFAGLVPCKSFFKACDACPPFPDRVSVFSRLKNQKKNI